MRKIILSGLAITLFGCGTAPRIVPGDSYLIDTQRGLMCSSAECYYLNLVHASHDELEVARQYGLPVKVYRWTSSQFVELMVAPPGNLYTTTQLSETEYQLPKNKATDAAFDLLYKEYLQLYKSGLAGEN